MRAELPPTTALIACAQKPPSLQPAFSFIYLTAPRTGSDSGPARIPLCARKTAPAQNRRRLLARSNFLVFLRIVARVLSAVFQVQSVAAFTRARYEAANARTIDHMPTVFGNWCQTKTPSFSIIIRPGAWHQRRPTTNGRANPAGVTPPAARYWMPRRPRFSLTVLDPSRQFQTNIPTPRKRQPQPSPAARRPAASLQATS